MKIKLFLAILLLLLFTSYVYSSDNAGEFLDIGIGARVQGMGRAYAGLSDDIYGMYANPAGLCQAKIKDIEVGSMHSKLFDESISLNQLGLAYSLNKKARIGISYLGIKVDDIYYTASDYEDTREILGKFSDKQEAYHLTYSRQLSGGNASFGIGLKYIKHKLKDADADGWGIDIGVIYNKSKKLTLGLVFQNALSPGIKLKWSTGNTDTIPLLIKLGFAYKMEVGKEKKGLIIVGDIDRKKHRDETYHLGVEYQATESIRLRAGSDKGEVCLGLGIKVSNYQIDYSFTTHTYADISKLSLTGRL